MDNTSYDIGLLLLDGVRIYYLRILGGGTVSHDPGSSPYLRLAQGTETS